MTDQKYKLVPVEPTGKMTKAAMGALPPSLHRLDIVSINAAVRHAIAAAPEPVCRWTLFDDEIGSSYWESDCGRGSDRAAGGPRGWEFCPHCRKKVEVVEDE